MKFMKRARIYKAKNVTFNPSTLNAYSYGWWRFVARIDGITIFNSFKYSVTTGRHQSKVSTLMNQLGIQVDLTLKLPLGIRTGDSLSDLFQEAEEHLCIEYLESEIKREERNAKARQRRVLKKSLLLPTLQTLSGGA